MQTNKHICITTSLICIFVLLISHVAVCRRAFTELFFADENVALKYLVECIHMKLIHNAAFSRPYLLLWKCLLLPALKCIIQHPNHKLLATCTSFLNGKHPVSLLPVSLLQGNVGKNYSSESAHLSKGTNFTLGFTRTIPVW